MNSRVLVLKKDELSHNDILSVVQKENFILHIKSFCNPDSLSLAQQKLYDHDDKGRLRQAEEFGRLGYAYSEIDTDDYRALYHKNATQNIQKIRNLFTPYLSPMDELRLILDEKWNAGAHLLQVDDQKCFVGICRYQDSGVDLKPHTDNLERTLPKNTSLELAAQLSINIYIHVPDEGGELEIWDIEPTEEKYSELMGDRHYGIDRDKLPTPAVVVKPTSGDLIILNPRLIHSVRPVKNSSRITLSTFLGYQSEKEPLFYWS